MKIFKISDITKTPGSRLKSEHSENQKHMSAESIRDNHLFLTYLVARGVEEPLRIDLDGTAGYAGSFLDELFGGMIRIRNVNGYMLLNTLHFKSNDDLSLIQEITTYIIEAIQEENGN